MDDAKCNVTPDAAHSNQSLYCNSFSLQHFGECHVQEACSSEAGGEDWPCGPERSIVHCGPWDLCYAFYTGLWCLDVFVGSVYGQYVQYMQILMSFVSAYTAGRKPLPWLPDPTGGLSGYRQFMYFPLPDHPGSHWCSHRLFKGRFLCATWVSVYIYI